MALNLNGADYSFWNKDEKNKNVSRSGFDLSFKHAFTLNEGEIRPFFEEFLLPYSQLNVGNKFVIWQSPLATRNFTNQRVHTHYFAQSIKHMWHSYRQQQFGGRYQDYNTPELHFNTAVDKGESTDLISSSDSVTYDVSILNSKTSVQKFFNLIIKGNLTTTQQIDEFIAQWRSCRYRVGSLMDSFGFQTDVTFPEEICPNPWLNWLYVGSYRQFFMNKVLWRGDGSDPSSGMRKVWFPDDEEDFSFKVGSGNKSTGLVGRFWSESYPSGLDISSFEGSLPGALYSDAHILLVVRTWNYFTNSAGPILRLDFTFASNSFDPSYLKIDLRELLDSPDTTAGVDVNTFFSNHSDRLTEFYASRARQKIIEALNVIDLMEIRYRNFKNDYFTSSLPSPLIGGESSKPVISIDSSTLASSIDFTDSFLHKADTVSVYGPTRVYPALGQDSNASDPKLLYATSSSSSDSFGKTSTDNIVKALNRAKVSVSSVPGLGITLDNIRMLNATTLYLEALARSDGDYASFVRAIYGVTPSELDTKPFYVGGSSTSVITQDVVQTAPENENSDTLFGSVTQRGSAGNSSGIGKVISKDSMIVIGVMSIIPDTLYCQGIDQRWTARDKLDRPNPFFTGIQMQAIHNYEIFVSGDAEKDMDPFGYQGAFDFMRYRSNRVSGLVKPHYNGSTLLDKPFSQMTQVRYFTETPSLNMDFVSTKDNVSHEHLAVTDTETTPEFVVMVANNVSGVLPLPYYAVPQKV